MLALVDATFCRRLGVQPTLVSSLDTPVNETQLTLIGLFFMLHKIGAAGLILRARMSQKFGPRGVLWLQGFV